MPLPPGLSINKATGRITGRPTVAGTFTGVMRVADATGAFTLVPYSLNVLPYDPPKISGALQLMASRGVAYSAEFGVANGTPEFSWGVVGSVPAGISMSADGVLSGTPTTANYGDVPLAATVTDSVGSVDQLPFTLRYRNRLSIAGPIPPAIVGASYSQGPTREGGHDPVVFAISGELPSGFSFNSSTGRITGAATSQGTTELSIIATDASGVTSAALLTLNAFTNYTPVAIGGALANTSIIYAKNVGGVTLPSSGNLSASGGNAPLTIMWERVSGSPKVSALAPGSLGTGFSISAEGGEVVSATFRLTATDGSTSATYTVTITGENTYLPLRLLGDIPGSAVRGVPYNGQYTVNGGAAPFAWTAFGLIPGLTLNPGTGVISGIPTASGASEYTMVITVTDSEGVLVSRRAVLTYTEGLGLSSSNATGYAGAPLTWSPMTIGGAPPFTYAVTGGTLPAGMTINTSNGTISGTPLSPGVKPFTVTVTDSSGAKATTSATFTISEYSAVTASWTIGEYATTGVGFSGAASAGGGTPPYTFSIASGALPPGVSLNATTGQVSGTPKGATGTYTSSVRASDSAGGSAVSSPRTVVLRNIPVMTGRAFTARQRGQEMGESVAAIGELHTPLTYSTVSGAMPAGASLNQSTGLISGTLTGGTFGGFSTTVKVVDAVGNQASASYTMAYSDGLGLSVSAPSEATAGRSYSGSLTAVGGSGAKSYSISPALPAGISLSGSTGAISGAATASKGDTTYTVTVSDASTSASAQFNLRVYPQLQIGITMPGGTAGSAYSGQISGSGGKPGYGFGVINGTLPAGLSLNTSTGAVTGTPTAGSGNLVQFRVQDQLGNVSDVGHTFAIAAAPAPVTFDIGGEVGDYGIYPTQGYCSMTFGADGKHTLNGSSSMPPRAWVTGGNPADYEFYMTNARSGGVGTVNGTFNAWVAPGFANFSVETSGSNNTVVGGHVDVTVRNKHTQQTVASGRYSYECSLDR